MFLRNKFITNSSSSSFIAWGFVFRGDNDPSKTFEYRGEFFETFDRIPGVEASSEWDVTDTTVIYVTESHRNVDEDYCVISLPPDLDRHEDWYTVLKEAADQTGIPLKGAYPGWFLMFHAS
jgi:hypothetical protein